LLQLTQSLLSASAANTLQPGQIELTYIGVAPQARGQGLGKSILTAFVATARAARYTSVALSVETDNSAALALYTKFGFAITHTFTEGRYHRHRMEYQLAG
jgi:ribosomal protein S18 acetylase RimI-like enzyme